MNIVRKALTTLGGILLAALLIAALAPKATRGVAAALVQVTNTSANPVPTVSADANFPFSAQICDGICGSMPNSFSVPSTTTTGVPVKRLVIEDLNASCSLGSGQEPGSLFVNLVVPTPADTNVPGINVIYKFPLTTSPINQSFEHAIVRIYADPLGDVGLSADAQECIAILTGHLETK